MGTERYDYLMLGIRIKTEDLTNLNDLQETIDEHKYLKMYTINHNLKGWTYIGKELIYADRYKGFGSYEIPEINDHIKSKVYREIRLATNIRDIDVPVLWIFTEWN